jgi:5-methylcytosine-specific restriction endonuclease McrA
MGLFKKYYECPKGHTYVVDWLGGGRKVCPLCEIDLERAEYNRQRTCAKCASTYFLWEQHFDPFRDSGLCPNCNPAEQRHRETEERVAAFRAVHADTRAELARNQDLRWEIFERDGYLCRRCGGRRDLTIDHITPVIAGGTNDKSNLQTLCRTCNSHKGAR